MPEWLKKLIKKWKEQGINPVPGTWMADLFKWDETGERPRVLPGEVSPIEAALTHLPSLAGGMGKALGEEAAGALPGFLNLFNVRDQALARRTALDQEVLPPARPAPPVVPFTGNMGTLPGPAGQGQPVGVGSPGLFPGSTVTGQPGVSAHEAWRTQQIQMPKPKLQPKSKITAPSPPKIRQISRSPSKLFRRRAR